jgi:phage gpG-like protein
MTVVADYTVSGVNLDQFAGRLQNLSPALDRIGEYTEGLVRQAIVQGKTMGGKPLAPLSPNTIAEKRLRKKPLRVLQRDGGLLASITFVRTSGTEVMVGTNIEYAPWVILGTPAYQIRPKVSKRLRFYSANGWKSPLEVNHPGLPQRNIFDGFQERVGPFAEATIREYLERG